MTDRTKGGPSVSNKRRVHALAVDGGPSCRTDGVDLDITDDWSVVTCRVCLVAVESVAERWATPPTPFGDWCDRFRPCGWYVEDNLAVPTAIFDSYERWQEATDLAFARAVVAAADAGDEPPDQSEFRIERPS